MKTDKISGFLLNTIIFLTFLGFYAILLLAINAGMSGATRQLTIPLRMIIGGNCLLLFLNNVKKKSFSLIWFILFILFYIVRIFIDYTKGEFFYISYTNLCFYLISFVIIPFIGVSKADFTKIKVEKIFKIFLVSALLFSTFSIALYGRYIGVVSRLTSSAAGEDVISPLILSYCSSLIIGVVITYLIYNRKKINKLWCILSIGAMIMATVPFFLGASRGGIFALFFPFVLMGLTKLRLKNIFKYLILTTLIIGTFLFLDNYFESGLLKRFTGTTEAVETGGSSASRLQIWGKSFNQFVYHPLVGDKLNTVGVNHYPHNIYLEVLQSIGLIGFIPFMILILKAIKSSWFIFKNRKEYSWLAIFFLQALMHNMFSGAVYTAAWFWTSMALILAIDFNLKKHDNTAYN